MGQLGQVASNLNSNMQVVLNAYVQYQDTLYAQVQTLICSDKPIGGLVIDANK